MAQRFRPIELFFKLSTGRTISDSSKQPETALEHTRENADRGYFPTREVTA
jgi:hypothetical protein